MNKADLISKIKRQEFRNSTWNVADVVLLPFLMLAVTPYLIHKLGAQEYGIWMLVNSIMISIGIVNVGLGDAAIKFISQYHARDSKQDIARITNAGFFLSLLLLILVSVIGFIASLIISNYNPFKLQNELLHLASVSVMFGAILFGLKQLEQLILSVFRGFERYDSSSMVSMVSKFLLLTTQVTIVYLGYSVIQIFIGSVITSSIVVTVEILFVKSRYKYISFFPRLNKFTIKEIFSFSTWSWIQSILSIVVSQVDKFVVVTLAGPAFLAYYSLASTIGSQIHALFTAAVSWVFPKFSSKSEKSEDVSSLYYKMQLLVITGGLILISGLILFGDFIFKIWLGPETYGHSILLIKIFLFYIFINLLSIIPHFTLLGVNRIRIYTIFVFMSVLLIIGLMILCYYLIGVNGLAYGKMFAAAVFIPLMMLLVNYLLKLPLLDGIKLYLPTFLLASALYIKNYFSLILAGLGLLLLYYNYKTHVLNRKSSVQNNAVIK